MYLVISFVFAAAFFLAFSEVGAAGLVTFKIETIQYDEYHNAWSTNFDIAETKQRMLKGLKVNVADATFDTGDKTAMFEFSHPATAQTPALTDYRYIGKNPYNYVYFNCDNLENQTNETCELWRIVGVFYVDDGEGNYLLPVSEDYLIESKKTEDEYANWIVNLVNNLPYGIKIEREGL